MPVTLTPRRVTAALVGALVAAVVLGATTVRGGAGTRRVALTCGQTITASTTLTADMSCPNGDAVHVGASHVTLNLNGHQISGSGTGASAVVVLPAETGVAVLNGRITGFNGGVVLQGTFGKAQGIRASENTFGVVAAGDSDVVTGNTLFDNLADGIRVISGQKVQITNNTIRENTDDGIFLTASAANATISGNKSISNAGNGIDVDGPGTRITGNVANGNIGDGILVNDDTDTIGTNTASYNTKLGIDAGAGDIDAGGDRAIGNGNAHQCRNIVC